jgi:hypothetical protein
MNHITPYKIFDGLQSEFEIQQKDFENFKSICMDVLYELTDNYYQVIFDKKYDPNPNKYLARIIKSYQINIFSNREPYVLSDEVNETISELVSQIGDKYKLIKDSSKTSTSSGKTYRRILEFNPSKQKNISESNSQVLSDIEIAKDVFMGIKDDTDLEVEIKDESTSRKERVSGRIIEVYSGFEIKIFKPCENEEELFKDYEEWNVMEITSYYNELVSQLPNYYIQVSYYDSTGNDTGHYKNPNKLISKSFFVGAVFFTLKLKDNI